jgi:VanZ family protein
MAVIFALSAQESLPGHPSPAIAVLIERGGHLIEYAILAALCLRAVSQTLPTRRPARWAMAITLLYAFSDEWHQSFVPGRDVEVMDLVADLLGALLSLSGLHLWRRRGCYASATHETGTGSMPEPAPEGTATPVGRRDLEVADGM